LVINATLWVMNSCITAAPVVLPDYNQGIGYSCTATDLACRDAAYIYIYIYIYIPEKFFDGIFIYFSNATWPT